MYAVAVVTKMIWIVYALFFRTLLIASKNSSGKFRPLNMGL